MQKFKVFASKFIFVLVLSLALTIVSGIAGIPAFFAMVIYFMTGHISVWSAYLAMTAVLIILFYMGPRRRPVW